EEKLSIDVVMTLLQDYSQAAMDKTYVEECRLVDKDFVENDSKQQILNILDQLSLPEKLGNQYLLGAEDVEIKQTMWSYTRLVPHFFIPIYSHTLVIPDPVIPDPIPWSSLIPYPGHP
ncbi:hypothetical protein QZH41_016082, partial [Actinostola sp. cb2023]